MGEIIALSGYARSGKDTAADVLVSEFGFRKVAFADKLREVLYQLNPIIGLEGFTEGEKPTYVQQVIEEYGWNGYKETPYSGEIRRLLQRLGTEAGRQTLWDTIWIDAALAGRKPEENIVISDARFFNEFDAVRERGGVIWRIERPGVGPVSDHASETEAPGYKNFSRVLLNSGDLSYFQQLVREEYSMLRDVKDVPQAVHGTVKPPVPSQFVQRGQPSVGSHNVPKRTGKF